METWKPIIGFEGVYEVSDFGNVRRIAPWCDGRKTKPGLISVNPRKNGYVRVVLHRDRSKTHCPVHRLVMAAFVGPLPSIRHQVNHINGITSDNRIENLEYVTPSENRLHGCHVLGHKPNQIGEAHHLAKLTESAVIQIRRRYAEGEKQKNLATEFGVSNPTVSEICSRRTWNHVA